jgi:hypothetical protein
MRCNWFLAGGNVFGVLKKLAENDLVVENVGSGAGLRRGPVDSSLICDACPSGPAGLSPSRHRTTRWGHLRESGRGDRRHSLGGPGHRAADDVAAARAPPRSPPTGSLPPLGSPRVSSRLWGPRRRFPVRAILRVWLALSVDAGKVPSAVPGVEWPRCPQGRRGVGRLAADPGDAFARFPRLRFRRRCCHWGNRWGANHSWEGCWRGCLRAFPHPHERSHSTRLRPPRHAGRGSLGDRDGAGRERGACLPDHAPPVRGGWRMSQFPRRVVPHPGQVAEDARATRSAADGDRAAAVVHQFPVRRRELGFPGGMWSRPLRHPRARCGTRSR